jgi:hypothetical protein
MKYGIGLIVTGDSTNTDQRAENCGFGFKWFGAAPVRWTVYRLRFLISSPSMLHPKRGLPVQPRSPSSEQRVTEL